ncbi:aminoacyl-tRNA hydrolase [Xanthocytophaga flava]|uniref:aminoacyl-tRNA hydrolase n=1 Tax=Xanthocytophaga flava TaxID=3048013 RepID=UPI0028D0DE17|nr:aminoacyl-tRNA hydrolase [Xanthocytophaga flavus]MDJ1468021.1 aminoacyl-tRNA hydrolase [Xanthocytophaga flavus]
MKYLIVGLGNIGPEYELTRHNIGFLVVDQLADKIGTDFTMDRLAYRAEGRYKGKTLIIIKPTTYMNLSGKAVNYWLKTEKIPLENLLVITDDLALDYGKIRVRGKGSHGGHNGFRDIEAVLQTQEYARLRFGIGSTFSKGKQVDYVLGNFSKDEFAELPLHIDKACDAVFSFCTAGLSQTMTQFNS